MKTVSVMVVGPGVGRPMGSHSRFICQQGEVIQVILHPIARQLTTEVGNSFIDVGLIILN